jgi:hypothetical protein
VKAEKPPPGMEELILVPGARRLSDALRFEYDSSTSASLVAPTLIALEMHAGEFIALVKPSFPDETTVAIPTPRSKSMADLYAGNVLSQLPPNAPLPRARVTEAMLN